MRSLELSAQGAGQCFTQWQNDAFSLGLKILQFDGKHQMSADVHGSCCRLTLILLNCHSDFSLKFRTGSSEFIFSYFVYVESHRHCFRPLAWFSESCLALLAFIVFNCLEKRLRITQICRLTCPRLHQVGEVVLSPYNGAHCFTQVCDWKNSFLRLENVGRWLGMAAPPARDLAIDSRWNEQGRPGCGGLGTVARVRHNPATAGQVHSCGACPRASWKVK